ncbi:hypothetical protein Plhal304r1_c001g0000341 [Plasmopara halstedii]
MPPVLFMVMYVSIPSNFSNWFLASSHSGTAFAKRPAFYEKKQVKRPHLGKSG